jgi:hypothetical protein
MEINQFMNFSCFILLCLIINKPHEHCPLKLIVKFKRKLIFQKQVEIYLQSGNNKKISMSLSPRNHPIE